MESEVIDVKHRYYEETRVWPLLPPVRKRPWQLPSVPMPIAFFVTLAVAICAAKLIPVKPEPPASRAQPENTTTSSTPVCPSPSLSFAAVAKMPEPAPPTTATWNAPKARPVKRATRSPKR